MAYYYSCVRNAEIIQFNSNRFAHRRKDRQPQNMAHILFVNFMRKQ